MKALIKSSYSHDRVILQRNKHVSFSVSVVWVVVLFLFLAHFYCLFLGL